MAAVDITPDDLAPFASIDEGKAEAMIADAVAIAALDAPCILSDDFEHADAAKAIIRRAILRWNDVGSGAVVQRARAGGPFNESETLGDRRSLDNVYTDDEIARLKGLCTGQDKSAFDVDTVAAGSVVHADECTLRFGGSYCSCGAILTGYLPLWGSCC